jgi:Zn-dependent M28 family amino/carboxypeptidase
VPTDQDFATLGDIKDLGTESCNSGTCRVYSAVDTEDMEQGPIKFWIGESDHLMHKAVGEQVDDKGAVTTFTMEFFDYNQSVTIEAPIE